MTTSILPSDDQPFRYNNNIFMLEETLVPNFRPSHTATGLTTTRNDGGVKKMSVHNFTRI